MVSVNIKTGADKLVELISEKKKVLLDDAAKHLGVGKDVVREWAEFLEEEGMVSLEYSLSKIWITERRITKEDILTNAKEVISEKDALSRKIDVAITALQDETAGFEDIRKEFSKIQGHIKTEIDVVKNQLGELEKYDSLRKNQDKDILKQKSDYESFAKDAQDKLKQESQKYDELRAVIEKERKNLEQYSQKIDELRKLRSDYEHTLTSLKESLKNIDSVMNEYKGRFDDTSSVINNYTSALKKLDMEISEKKGSLLTQKLSALKVNEEKLFRAQLEIENNIKERMRSLQSHAGISDKVQGNFGGFFSKSISAEKLIAEIENDKTDLAKNLDALKSKVNSFTLKTTNVIIKSELKEIENKIKEYEHKKTAIKFNVEKLINIIRGK
jgi:chromosome segregation ATPase